MPWSGNLDYPPFALAAAFFHRRRFVALFRFCAFFRRTFRTCYATFIPSARRSGVCCSIRLYFRLSHGGHSHRFPERAIPLHTAGGRPLSCFYQQLQSIVSAHLRPAVYAAPTTVGCAVIVRPLSCQSHHRYFIALYRRTLPTSYRAPQTIAHSYFATPAISGCASPILRCALGAGSTKGIGQYHQNRRFCTIIFCVAFSAASQRIAKYSANFFCSSAEITASGPSTFYCFERRSVGNDIGS